MAPHLEPRRTLISTGHFRSNQIESFSLSSPFVHQARPRPSTSSLTPSKTSPLPLPLW